MPNPHDADRERLVALLAIAEAVRAGSDPQTRSFYQDMRLLAEESRSKAAFRSLERDLLVEFNEGVGPEVEEFWARVRAAGIALERRRDIVAETLALGRVRNMDEYVALEDAFEALQACGKVRPEEAERLNVLLDAFADAPKNRGFFQDAPEQAIPTKSPRAKTLEAGRLVRLSAKEHRYDYVGRALTASLQKKGLQGGGETWAGIARGLITLEAPALEASLRFDPEADCLAVWAVTPGPLRALDALLARAQADHRLLARALKRAAALGLLE